MATVLQRWAQFAVIIDLTVEDDPNAGIFIGHWLFSAREIHDAQTTKSQRSRLGKEDPVIVRATMTQSGRHRFHFARREAVVAQIKNATNSTHGLFFLLGYDFLRPTSFRSTIDIEIAIRRVLR